MPDDAHPGGGGAYAPPGGGGGGGAPTHPGGAGGYTHTGGAGAGAREQALGTEPEGAPSEPDVEPEIDTDFGAGAHDPVTDDDDDDHDDHDDDAADDDGFGDTSAESGGVDLTSVEDVTTDVGFPTVEEDAGDVPLMVDADDTAPHDPGEPDVPE